MQLMQQVSKRNPDISIPKDQKNKLRQTPWGEMTYLDYKKKIEFGKKNLMKLIDTDEKKFFGLLMGCRECRFP